MSRSSIGGTGDAIRNLGDEMMHMATEKWIDFVNNVSSGDEKAAMEKHLQLGCKRCQETVSFWQRVRQTATSEAAYQPPADIVRMAKVAFQGSEFAMEEPTSSGIQVLFDSFLQPMFQGARSAAASSRQILYRAEPFQVDLQIEEKAGGALIVSGQLLHLAQPEEMVRDTRVELSNMRGQSLKTATNEFGEFSAEINNSGKLQMTIANPDGEPITIFLKKTVGRNSGEKGWK